ncbi:MAG: thiamine pyrophosphate-dependent enzyme [Dehalococcoidia bacterium]
MFPSIEAIRAIAAARTDQVVVTTMTSIFEWDAVVGDDRRHLPLIGCMSKASSVALGVALARPDVEVLCLDGDGSLLMNLGSLATIAQAAPKNLVHFVFENRVYNITGGQRRCRAPARSTSLVSPAPSGSPEPTPLARWMNFRVCCRRSSPPAVLSSSVCASKRPGHSRRSSMAG